MKIRNKINYEENLYKFMEIQNRKQQCRKKKGKTEKNNTSLKK